MGRAQKRASASFDAAIRLIPDADYKRSLHPDSYGFEFAETRTQDFQIRHIRPIGGGYPEMAFILTAAGAYAVVKDNRDAGWHSAEPAKPTSRDVGLTVPGLRAPARLKGKKNA